jgi:hypothetical protein
MYAWVIGINSEKGILNLDVYIDNQKNPIGKLNMSETGWQSAALVGSNGKKAISLNAGMHMISLKCKAPYVPSVEFIRLAKDEKKAAISDLRYRSYIDSLKALTLPKDYVQFITEEDSASFTLMKVLPNPEGDYIHTLDINFKYTYYDIFHFYAGAPVTFETKKADPYASDPVMELFNSSDPINKGSWVDNNSGEGYQAKISCTIQYTGYYYLRVRAYRQGTSGTSNLYLYDNLYASDIAISGYGFRCDHSSTEELNYFTSHLTGDSRLWIEDQSAFPGRIRAYNDDYYGSGDFYWGLASRVKKSLSMPIRSALVSSYSSYNPTGKCDMYMNCGNSAVNQNNYPSSFPNLKADDAIRSAPASNVYNCISWSGGVTSTWWWPPSDWPWSNPNGSTPPLTAFDNYYGNKAYWGETYMRYTNADTYTRSGASSSNATVDLWAKNGSYTHGSVRKPGNNHPHGYDWESKPGGLMRTFHPRDKIGGPGSLYGFIDKYYRLDGTLAKASGPLIGNACKGMSLEESIAAGLTKIEQVEFSETENAKLSDLVKELQEKVKSEFNVRYNSWKETWSDPQIFIHSDPRKYAESKEYEEFLNFCKKEGKRILPLLFQQFEQGDYFTRNAIEDLTFGEYQHLMDEVREKRLKNLYDENGVYIAPSPRSGWMKYIKKLIASSDMQGQFKHTSKKSLTNTPDDFAIFQNYPNPLNPETQIRYSLPTSGRITLKIYDIMGREVAALVNDEIMSEGWYTVTWDGRDQNGRQVPSGIYFCRLITGTQVHTLKMMLMR